MPLHRLTSITIGVPNVAETAGYDRDLGLTETCESSFANVDGGEQVRLVHAPVRRLVELRIGADDRDDLGRMSPSMRAAPGRPAPA